MQDPPIETRNAEKSQTPEHERSFRRPSTATLWTVSELGGRWDPHWLPVTLTSKPHCRPNRKQSKHPEAPRRKVPLQTQGRDLSPAYQQSAQPSDGGQSTRLGAYTHSNPANSQQNVGNVQQQQLLTFAHDVALIDAGHDPAPRLQSGTFHRRQLRVRAVSYTCSSSWYTTYPEKVHTVPFPTTCRRCWCLRLRPSRCTDPLQQQRRV